MSLEYQHLHCQRQRLELVRRLCKAENRYGKKQNHPINEGIVARSFETNSERLQRLPLKGHDIRADVNEGVESKTKACVPRILFPQEIIDQFIDHLHDNVAALKECALVCRAWVYQSRWHLFRMIHILPPVLASDKGSFPMLSGLLEHPLCTFASSVRELSIFDPYKQNMSYMTTLDSSWINLLITQLSRLVSVNALDLTLSDDDAMVYCDAIILKAPSFTVQLTHLTLWVCNMASWKAIRWLSIMHSLQSLVDLKLIQDDNDRGEEWGEEDIFVPLTTAILPPTALRALRVTSWETTRILPVIQATLNWLYESKTRVSVLEFGFISMQSANDISTTALIPFLQYLRFLGSSLETLTLKFDGPLSMSLFLDIFKAAQNPQVRVLELEYPLAVNVGMQSFQDVYRLSFLFTFLSKISNPYLTTIVCEIRGMIKRPRDLTVQNQQDRAKNNGALWLALDNLLTGPSFPVLSVVDFRVIHSYASIGVDMPAEIEAGLPRCKQRGILRASMSGCALEMRDLLLLEST